ncbi:peptidase domain-containing ABC transporter [Stenotrophomonas sp. HITSZ_GD]|uniref:peptidase domain-containing ABC transporter n=1 Tax=Stenotrophomonas sp. HITSZ_GD TaxID=3037248 RepID=UPI00240E710A|nr:peptidase domain-containing ABC transporter [Stenotrophomonas sp. HITSZ_GD]MDG2525889.1 peptidase domain-containing ABC transporter [Stenotrophomonas sp. HITSZ_GD]
MKPILQSEAAECGLAALAMVAGAHGHAVTLAELRQRYATSLKGASLGQLIGIAQDIGLSARPLRLEIEHLHQLRVPCILHWDLNHFVVLAKVSRGKALIFDPALGERRLALAEVSRHFTGVALELVPNARFQRRRTAPSVSIRQLTGRVRGAWSSLAQVLALSLALQVFVVLAPFYSQWVIDQVLVSADRDLLAVLGLGFGLALLLQIAIGLLRGWTVVQLSASLGLQWMGNVFAHLLRLPLDYFEKRHLGDITSRLGSVQSIQRTLTTNFVEALIDGLMAAVTLVLMLVYSWKLALVTLCAVLAYLGIRALAFRPLRDGTERQLVAAARQESHLLESLRGIQSLKIAGEEPRRRAGYENLMVDTVNAEVRLARLDLGFGTASQLVFGLERVAVVWIAAVLALRGVFSVGMLVAYLAYKDQFAGRMSALIDKWMELRMLRLHGERLADIVLATPDEGAGLASASLPAAASLEIQGLRFRYADGEPWVLEDCSLRVAEGESVAIIGASGCGKSTLLKLLLGLQRPQAGTIRLGGEDLWRLGPARARAMFGVVMQDDQLFAGSIADNISFFDPAFDLGRVEEAARLAAVHEDILAMPMGYHGLIGDMGSALSGGQKQRLILARALYRRPRVLVLDEATSHLDVAREQQVSEAVRQLRLTRVIVAHRPETIASADRILVMDAGRIVEEIRPRAINDPGSPG